MIQAQFPQARQQSMSDYTGDTFVVILENGMTFVAKPLPAEAQEIGEPDCIMKDAALVTGTDDMEWKDRLSRYPSRSLTKDREFRIHSDKILTIVAPTNELLSEYLVAISD